MRCIIANTKNLLVYSLCPSAIIPSKIKKRIYNSQKYMNKLLIEVGETEKDL